MADRRMMSKTVIETDSFMDMPFSSQALYFHLLLRADDDGFIKSPKSIIRQINAREDDMKLLIAKQYVICFDSGVIVIKHWKIHNYIRTDRYKKTDCPEVTEVVLNKGGEYIPSNSDVGMSVGIPSGSQVVCQSVDKMDTQVRLGKVSIGKVSIEREAKAKAFKPPSLEEVQQYIAEKGYIVDAEKFINYYESNGWMVGRTKMKDWKAAVRSWQSREKGYSNVSGNGKAQTRAKSPARATAAELEDKFKNATDGWDF